MFNSSSWFFWYLFLYPYMQYFIAPSWSFVFGVRHYIVTALDRRSAQLSFTPHSRHPLLCIQCVPPSSQQRHVGILWVHHSVCSPFSAHTVMCEHTDYFSSSVQFFLLSLRFNNCAISAVFLQICAIPRSSHVVRGVEGMVWWLWVCTAWVKSQFCHLLAM